MFDLKEVVGKKSQNQFVTVDLQATLTVARRDVWEEMLEESAGLDETNDANFVISQYLNVIIDGWQEAKEREKREAEREALRRQKEAEEEARKAAVTTIVPEGRRRGQAA